MAKPCAVFWDIKNINVPQGQSVDSIVNLIRSNIIKPYNLNEIFFFCVYDVDKLSPDIGHSLTNLDFQACNGVKYSAKIKIKDLMRKFVKVAGQDCTIILLSGDGDFYDTLSDLKKLHNVSIHLIRLANSFSPKLDQISDYTFMLTNDVLMPVGSTGNPLYFISIKNYPLSIHINQVMNEFNSLGLGNIGNSAILYGSSICIGFPTLWNAENAVKKLNGTRLHGTFLKTKLIIDSPLTQILKCIKPDGTMQIENNAEVKQLTFIKMNNSNETVDDSKIIKFCIACTAQSGSQCILSRESNFWLVFSCKSDAQIILPKVQMIYPDAVICETPNDLTSKCLESPYTVESCEKMLSNGEPSSVSLDGCDDIDRKIFFRYNSNLIDHKQPTKWSLLYNLFEKLYDLGAKKVIFDGNLYCAHFDSASDYRDAFEQIHSRNLKPLALVYASESHKQKIDKKMNRYTGIPWCLNEQLDLCCLVVKTASRLRHHLIEISKNILGNRECIFIKYFLGEIWIGFPNNLFCTNSEKTVFEFAENRRQIKYATVDIPSNELLESIDFRDLVGDAYDLAFLSSQLESLKSIPRPKILQEISLQRIMKKQECDEAVFHFSIFGEFTTGLSWRKLWLKQVVKIFVKFSKVIPLAATATYRKINLMYNSWHEAHAARHFINNLTSAEVPYFTEFNKTSNIKQKRLACSGIYFYIINDQRKVLEKIVHNESLIDQLSLVDSNSSTVQSTSDIDVLDEEIRAKKLQYVFVITTYSGFKFTPGMISIIKIRLLLMDCPVFIEFDDKIWFAVDDLEKGDNVKAEIEMIKFKMLHEKDKEDFTVHPVLRFIKKCPTKVAKMLENKLIKRKTSAKNIYFSSDAVPLGHFNYNYREAVGMSTSRYCRLNALS